VVSGIAGDRRFLVVIEGRFDHSGATPMGTKFRNDVNLAMAYIQVELDALGRLRTDDGHVFCQTVGIVNADPEIDRKHPDVHSNSVTKVSGLGYFTIDLMSADDEFMDAYAAEMLRLFWKVAKRFGVNAIVEQTDNAAGIKELDAGLMKLLEECCDQLGHSHLSTASGAGHDAVIAALA
jgi:N-carbamoyl-L-amino-acid hydrolase